MESGATDHMLIHDFFYSYQYITLVNIKLPNGNMTIAKCYEIVVISPGFTMYNVLFVAEFNMNLLSVLKLCFNFNCVVNFNNAKCLIQEKKNLRMIGSIDLVE